MSSGVIDLKADKSKQSNNFINHLLGQMKNQFNKKDQNSETESNENQDTPNDETIESSEIKQEPPTARLSNETNEQHAPSNSLSETQMESDLNCSSDTETPNQTKKPRIVITFRKPIHKSFKRKSKVVREDVVVKRSPRRRSRDYGESVLQSAIARKEKSYNETYKPQRLSRQLKATPKILQNLANAALKIDKEIPSKPQLRKIKSSHNLKNFTKDTDDSSQMSPDVRNSEGCLETSILDEQTCRRSHRISSKQKEQVETNGIESDETSTSSEFVTKEKCSSLCLCTEKSHFYVASITDSTIYCNAIDSIEEKLIGCNNTVNNPDLCLFRPSKRIPFTILCETHLNRMIRHNCCPTCGLFCTQGRFVQCEAKHHYHKECQVNIEGIESCPHCGNPTLTNEVLIRMHSSTKPIFLPTQRLQLSSAKMTFCKNDKEVKSPSPSMHLDEIRFSTPILNEENENHYDLNTLLDSIRQEDNQRVAEILSINNDFLKTHLKDYNNSTILHFTAENGFLSTAHLLVRAGGELDAFDKDQNTPLITAIMGFKDSIIKYLIKAGTSLTLKGTDGMTPLHIAAKCGNLFACQQILEATFNLRNYINTVDDGGWTPLVWACEHNRLEIVKFLIKNGADASIRDVEQNLALHWASFSGNAQITQILLNVDSDVNAMNAHGDTPLHIAARQDNHNTVVVLLSRGADTNILNKEAETALDCSCEQGECYNVISFNMHLETILLPDRTKKTILSNDITHGKETNPIQCINQVDDECEPTNFTYISKNLTNSNDVTIDTGINTMQFCKCNEKCMSGTCNCCRNSVKCWYDEDGRLSTEFNYIDSPLLFECNQLCDCNAITCSNRVVQRGVTSRFQLFKTNLKGWGVSALCNIQKGSFVCEYVGEIISNSEADKREDDCYIFDLDSPEIGNSYCIDAKFYGNFSRFINHSCDPNLAPVRLFIDHHDLRFPRIAFFAKRNIPSGEELSFDYGEEFWLVKYKLFTCVCQSEHCKYSKEAMQMTLENFEKVEVDDFVDVLT